MLVGIAVGLIAGNRVDRVGAGHPIRPDVVIALVVGVPSAIGMLVILLSGRAG